MLTIRHCRLLLFVLALVLVSVTACALSVEPTPQPSLSAPTDTPVGEPFEGDLRVDSIDIVILESFPVQVRVMAKGQVRDGCVKIERVIEERKGNIFQITLVTERLANARCTDEPQPFEHGFALDVLGLKAGVYTVTVNGVSDTFELAVDNVPPSETGRGEIIIREANVERIELLILESFPVQVHVVAKGTLFDSCTKIDRIEQRTDTASLTLWVKITTARPADAICTQEVAAFEEVISLDVYGLLAGTYTVDVNGVTSTFTLAVDNVPQG